MLTFSTLGCYTDFPMADSTILDTLHDDILRILQLCHIHTASIAVRCLAGPSEHRTYRLPELRCATPDEQKTLGYKVSGEEDISFLIASITKVLVAIAFTMMTVDEDTNLDVQNKRNRFNEAQWGSMGLTAIYNKHKKDSSKPDMVDLPGDPSISHLLSHFKGMPSSNHRLFAPDGSALMTKEDVVLYAQELNNLRAKQGVKSNSWTQYSNLNYALIGMAIEALWDGTLSDFMDSTLFRPLGIGNSTTIGYEANPGTLRAGRYVVDSQGTLHSINAPNYASSGAEAAALGGYSCIKDLDKIFTNILQRFATPSPDEKTFAAVIEKQSNRQTEDIEYSRLGLFTAGLDSPTIGSMSTNQLMFPDKKFATYLVAPHSKKRIETYHHAGSAIGCGCAYSLLPHKDADKAFSVVVLTNTSGPVDASDHILRLILRRIHSMMTSSGTLANLKLKFDGPEDIMKMVIKAWDASSKVYKRFEEEDAAMGLDISTDISGTYKLRGFPQHLEIRPINGRPHITFHGSARSSEQLRLAWLSSSVVRICVPESGEPHISIDRLGNGEWANLEFQVKMNNGRVVALVRKTNLSDDWFEWEWCQQVV